MNFKNLFLALSLFASTCHANLNTVTTAQAESADTLKEVVIAPYNKETDEQGLRSFLTTWFKHQTNQEIDEKVIELEVSKTIQKKIDTDQKNIHLVCQGTRVCGLISFVSDAEPSYTGIIYFDSSILDAHNNSPVLAKIVKEFKKSETKRIHWLDFNGTDTEKRQHDIKALIQHGFASSPFTIYGSTYKLDAYELVLEKKQ